MEMANARTRRAPTEDTVMTKAIRYGLAVAVAITSMQAAADGAKSDERSRSDSGGAISGKASRGSLVVSRSVPSGQPRAAQEPGSGSGEVAEADSTETKAAQEERWLIMREGYRDGGY
jgi:hypothetical protein